MLSHAAMGRPSGPWVGLLCCCALLTCAQAWAFRLPQEEPGLPVYVYALWNAEYLCFAAKVSDPMITGSSTGPMSTPEQDDAIEFALEAPGPAGAEAHRLIISAAGGMTVLSRDPRGRWRTDPSWVSGPQTLKYAVTLNGTLNHPADTDVGFTVECAIPWRFLGGQPPVGREIRFNTICWLQGENEGMVSWSQMVTSSGEAGDTSRWGRMLVSSSATPATAQGAYLSCPFAGHQPFVDGKLDAGEWLTASTLSLEKPKPSLQPAPTPGQETGVVGTLLAIYRYDWQGDPERPGAHFWLPDGRPATIDQPKEAPGPWYSYERVLWHRSQLNEIQRAGIDIILPRYRGDEESRRTWARVGLDRLSEALKTMRAEGHSYPLVGMMLDTAALQAVDLKSESGKALLSGMIRDFFLHVPREFWAELGARPQQGVAGGVPVLLGEPEGISDWDGSFLEFAQRSFAAEFGGARLVWLGSSRWRSRGAEGFYAYLRLPGASGFTQEGAGGASAVAISPGYVPPPGTSGDVRPRREGRAYRGDWQKALAAAPGLVLLNSWNDFADGTDLAPSRQYGFVYVDLTRYFSARLGSRQPHLLRLRKQAVPKLLLPGRDYQAELLVENVGTEDFRSGRRTSVDYRIVRRSDGKVVRTKVAAEQLAIMAGQTLRLPITIAARDDRGQPLPPGDYLFSVLAMRSSIAYVRSPWFAKPEAELTVPITVGQPPPRRLTVISTSLASSIEAGATQNVVVRLRNDGSETWRAAGALLSYHWLRCDDDLGATSPGSHAPIADGARASLPRDVPPGDIVSVMIPVSARGKDGDPLSPVPPGDLWHYRVEWDLVAPDGQWFSAQGDCAASEPISVIPHDRGVLFQSAAAPASMQAGGQAQVEVAVTNAGPRPWSAQESHLLWRWYRWDGRPVAGAQGRTPLPSDLASGQQARITASLKAPAVPGPYWLVWDMVANGEGYAAAGSGRRADLLVMPVMVQGGEFRAIDLSKLANVIAVTDDAHRARGDFDGEGRSFPAECLPPDQSGAADRLYPSGYYAPASAHSVPFSFPDLASGCGGAVACDGQSLSLGERGVSRIHLLLASAAAQEQVALGLKRDTGEVEQVTLAVPGWRPTGPEQEVGAYAPYVRTLTGDDASAPACLYHRTIAPSTGLAVSLELPRQPSVRIMAITVEGE